MSRRADRGELEADVVPQSQSGMPLNEEMIRMRAYAEWEAAGRPDGDPARFWLDAESELM